MTIQDMPVIDFLLLVGKAAVLGLGSFLVLGFLFLGGKEFFSQMFDTDFRVGDTQSLKEGSAYPLPARALEGEERGNT